MKLYLVKTFSSMQYFVNYKGARGEYEGHEHASIFECRFRLAMINKNKNHLVCVLNGEMPEHFWDSKTLLMEK